MAFELREPEPDNIEEQLQTAETSNMEKNIQEKLEEEICIDPLDFLSLSWNSENSENSSENSENSSEYISSESEIYMSPVNLSSDDMDSGTSDSYDMDSDTSNEDDVVVEEDENRNQILDAITDWMKTVYQQKLEEEIVIIRNCDKLDWTDTRFTTFRLLCREEINETIEMINEGSILAPLSKEE